MLHIANAAIDTIQGAQSILVKNYVQDKTTAESLQTLVDTQTTFAKSVAKAAYDAADVVVGEFTKFATSLKK
jgi:hypothetical protein